MATLHFYLVQLTSHLDTKKARSGESMQTCETSSCERNLTAKLTVPKPRLQTYIAGANTAAHVRFMWNEDTVYARRSDM